MTKQAVLTKRGVLYVGLKCNVNCLMCYYRMTETKEWRALQDCRRDVDLFRSEYDNRFIDITGGEPTVFPHTNELVEYCRNKQILPTIITNGIALSSKDKLRSLKSAGVNDLLISVHALGEEYNKLTQTADGSDRQRAALENVNELEVPWRANVVVMRTNLNQLQDISDHLIKFRCSVANFIVFNPFYEWSDSNAIDFQASHSEISGPLAAAIDALERNNVMVNARYYPYCLLPNHAKNICGFSQLSYDPHEWDFFSWYRLDDNTTKKLYHTGLMEGMNFSANPEEIAKFRHALNLRNGLYVKAPACARCSVNPICDGLAGQYAKRFGLAELRPFNGTAISEPKRLMQTQEASHSPL